MLGLDPFGIAQDKRQIQPKNWDFAIPLEWVDDAAGFAFVQTYPGYTNFNFVY